MGLLQSSRSGRKILAVGASSVVVASALWFIVVVYFVSQAVGLGPKAATALAMSVLFVGKACCDAVKILLRHVER